MKQNLCVVCLKDRAVDELFWPPVPRHGAMLPVCARCKSVREDRANDARAIFECEPAMAWGSE